MALYHWIIQAYLDQRWQTVRVSACQSYCCDLNDEDYDVPDKGYPPDFKVSEISNYHSELDECYRMYEFNMDYRILSCPYGFYYMGDRNWSYYTLEEIENGSQTLLNSRKLKLVNTLRILGLDAINDKDKIRFVYGFSGPNVESPGLTYVKQLFVN
jgi:hypothetical protein